MPHPVLFLCLFSYGYWWADLAISLGWLFFGFGMVFVWVFGGSAALHNLVFFSGELNMIEGTITEIVETSMEINEETVYEYRYRYIINDKRYEGASSGFYGEYQVGDQAVITYSVADQARSRLAGLSIWSPVMWLPAIFPLIGLGFMAVGIRKAIKGARLLRHGVPAIGTLISRETTNATVNDQTVYKFTFQFQTDMYSSHTVVAKTHVTERLAGEPDLGGSNGPDGEIREPLLYNPSNPDDAVLLDDLPGGPRLNHQGEIEAVFGGLLLNLIIPTITVIGHGAWLLAILEIL